MRADIAFCQSYRADVVALLKVNAIVSKMIPSKSMGKFAYDSVKVSNLRKKMPLSKLLPANSTEKQFEKELNVAFAQVRKQYRLGGSHVD